MTAQAYAAGSASDIPVTPSQSFPERRARFLPGIPMLVLGIVLIIAAAAAFWLARKHPGDAAVGLAWAGALLILAAIFRLGGLTPVTAGRGPGRPAVRQVPGHRPRPRPALGEPVPRWRRVSVADPQPGDRRWPRSTTPTATRSRSPPSSSGRSGTRPRPRTRSRLRGSSSPSRPRPPSGTSRPATLTTAAAAACCRCATTPTRSPSGCRPRSPHGCARPASTSSRPADPAVLRPRDRPGHAAPAAGQRRGAARYADRRGRRRHGPARPARLAEENVVELDEERKAAMVSNLLVVLCSEQATQQVVNTGSLYQ